MKTYAIGDIHGYLKPLQQCLQRCDFDFENDRLICLGDVANRGPETYECFELLLTAKNLIYILGNHDTWLLDYFNKPKQPIDANWFKYGGRTTLASYKKNNFKLEKHHQLLSNAHLFYLDEKNRLYVHGGFEMGKFLAKQTALNFCWDRTVWYNAVTAEKNIEYQLNSKSPICSNSIFMGHTCTHRKYADLSPQNFVNVWNLDQGAGHGYKLSIMEVESFAYWQSDLVSSLY